MVPQSAVLRLDVVLGETIDWLFILISVVSALVVVRVFFLNQFSLVVVEELDCVINILKPGVFVDLADRDSLSRIYFKQLAEQVSCIL